MATIYRTNFYSYSTNSIITKKYTKTVVEVILEDGTEKRMKNLAAAKKAFPNAIVKELGNVKIYDVTQA